MHFEVARSATGEVWLSLERDRESIRVTLFLANRSSDSVEFDSTRVHIESVLEGSDGQVSRTPLIPWGPLEHVEHHGPLVPVHQLRCIARVVTFDDRQASGAVV